ncbi:MAG: cytochrome b5 domain-containing protein [Oligoflexus sp.]|jgi:cytochrome b involved in lipid metabolism
MKLFYPCVLLLALAATERLQSTEELKVFTSEEVARHDSKQDCWLMIEGMVYDVTNYLPKHPKKYSLVGECGHDVTEGWKTKGDKNKPHTRKAEAILKKQLIGRAIEP